MAISIKELAERYCVSDGSKFRLKQVDPDDKWKFKSREHAQELLDFSLEQLCNLQERLYAQDRWALLLIFQAMDAAGKDSTVKHVFSGVNPQGCQVTSFKAPSNEELDHDFLWRCQRHLPERGHIGIFNRSYYEEVLVVRVHRELLAAEKLPPERVGKKIWKDRFDDLSAYERYLDRNGVIVRKFFLHVSKKEQKQRFLDRLDEPEKHWKFSVRDVEERKFWPEYMAAYEDMVQHTATAREPWYVVPADHKWFTRLVVASAIVETLESLKLQYPKPDTATKKGLGAARAALLRD